MLRRSNYVSTSNECEFPGDAAPEELSNSGEKGAIVPYVSEIVCEDADEDSGISTLDKTTDDCEQRISKETTPSSATRTRTYWQPPMDRYFINLMFAHVHKGNQFDGVFSKQTWMEIISSFNERFGFEYSVDILKNRYKTLRRQYNLIKSLLQLDGFAWDETRHMVIANDCVWQDYVKVRIN